MDESPFRAVTVSSWLWMMLNLVVMAILVGNLTFYAALTATWADWLMALFILLGLTWLVIQFYTLAYLMEQERKHFPLALRNALFTAVAAPGYTLVVAGFAALVIALSAGLVFPLFLGGPCLIAMLGNHAVRERLETYRVRERDLANRGPETGQPSFNSH